MQNILIIGFDTRNIVCSAKKAGYTVHSIDAFQDFDLQKCACSSERYECADPREIRDMDPAFIRDRLKELEMDFDALVLGSGLENFECRDFPCPVLASQPENIKIASDKADLAKKLKELGLPHPYTYSPEEKKSIRFPVMVKPSTGGGGILNRVAGSMEELQAVLEDLSEAGVEGAENVIIQEFLEGVPASVSVLSTETEARAVAVNEQLIGVSWLSELPFSYCGNITPFETPFAEEMENIAEELVLEYGLVGSNGVDFLLTEKGPVVLEINPRFQGSLDTVELATSLNLFEAHVRCFSGELPEKPGIKQFAIRGVLYSDRELFIDGERMRVILGENTVDIPNAGDVIEPDGPLTSILAIASGREEALGALKAGAAHIKTTFGIEKGCKKAGRVKIQ